MARRVLAGGGLAALALVAGAAPAAAHPSLLQAAPAPGLSVPSAPRTVALALSEPAIARGSRIVVRGPGGAVGVGRVRAADGGRTLSVALRSRVRPGVYEVDWSALGDDGHATGGRFRFGVQGRGGTPPPGAERLTGAGGVGRGEQRAAAQGAVTVIARWLGVLAAALLLGGGLLARRSNPARDRWRAAAPLALLLGVVVAVGGVLAEATAGAGGALDVRLLGASGAGVAAVARLGALLAAALGARVARLRDAAWVAGGAGALVATGLDGHVLTVRHDRALALGGQVVHTLAAGVWLGGLLLLGLLAVRVRDGGARAALGDAARAFATLAPAALGAAFLTGALAAVREVHHWYFLRWSDYGRLVIAKAALVVVAAAAGAFIARRGARPRVLRTEAIAVVVVAALASALAAVPAGRGQPLPAVRGTLLPGPAIASALTGSGVAHLTLAPARAGDNRLVVDGPRSARSGRVRLACACARHPLVARLRAGAATIRLPAEGTWYAYVAGGRSPAALTVGVPGAPGAPPVEVLAAADLSGPGADRCRSLLVGLELGVGRLNALGGLDGGHKVVLTAFDTGGSAQRAAAAVRGRRAVALAGACGAGGDRAVRSAATAGLPSIVGDPAVAPVSAPRVFRLAGDPAAEGYAAGRYLVRGVVAAQADADARDAPSPVRAYAARDALGRRWLAGLRRALAGATPADAARWPAPDGAGDPRTRGSDRAVRVVASSPARFAAAPARALDRRRTAAVVLDGPAAQLAAALRRAGRPGGRWAPAPVIASERTFSEAFVGAAGSLGRLGVVRGASEISPDSRDALAYAQAVGELFPGERPTLEGLRGYATGLALAAAVRGGTAPDDVVARLRRPAPFTDAIAAPWRADAPAAGAQRFTVLGPTFLAATLVPPSAGGESFSGRFFADGAWRRLTSDVYGPPLAAPVLSARR